VDQFSSLIEAKVAALVGQHREVALEIAREWDYATATEREEAQQWNAENGFCSHGNELGCCPAGCGSV